MISRNDTMMLTAMLALCSLKMHGATRADLPAINAMIADMIPNDAARNAASVWAEHMVIEKELRAGIDTYNDDK
jgi:hypothetical protein